MDPGTGYAIGAVASTLGSLFGGAMQSRGAARQNRISREASGRQAAQLDPFVNALTNYDTSALAQYDVSGLTNFDTSALSDFAAQLQEGGVPAMQSLGALNLPGTVNTGALRDFSAGSLRASETSGLEAQAERQLERQSGRLDAALAARGIYNAGAGARQQRQLTADVFGNLAAQINEDQRMREQAALGLEQSSLAQALGLDVTQRGQTVQARTAERQQNLQQGMANLDAQTAFQRLLGDTLTNETESRRLALTSGLTLGSQNLANAMGYDLRALEGAAGLVASTPGYGFYDRDTGLLYNQEGAFEDLRGEGGGRRGELTRPPVTAGGGPTMSAAVVPSRPMAGGPDMRARAAAASALGGGGGMNTSLARLFGGMTGGMTGGGIGGSPQRLGIGAGFRGFNRNQVVGG